MSNKSQDISVLVIVMETNVPLLTVGAGLELERGAAGSVSGCCASSDLQQVGGVGLQTIQSHITTPSTKDGVAGLLLLLEEKPDKGRRKLYGCSLG